MAGALFRVSVPTHHAGAWSLSPGPALNRAMTWKEPFRIGPVIDPMDDARLTLRMIREFIELHAPPGTFHDRLHTRLRATDEADALIESLRKHRCPTRTSSVGIAEE